MVVHASAAEGKSPYGPELLLGLGVDDAVAVAGADDDGALTASRGGGVTPLRKQPVLPRTPDLCVRVHIDGDDRVEVDSHAASNSSGNDVMSASTAVGARSGARASSADEIPVNTSAVGLPRRLAIAISRSRSSPTTAVCWGRAPSTRHISRSATDEGLPSVIARAPVVCLMPAMTGRRAAVDGEGACSRGREQRSAGPDRIAGCTQSRVAEIVVPAHEHDVGHARSDAFDHLDPALAQRRGDSLAAKHEHRPARVLPLDPAGRHDSGIHVLLVAEVEAERA